VETSSLFLVSSVRLRQLFSKLAVGGLLLGGILTAHGQATNVLTASVWSDEFNGTNLDLTKWTFDIGNGAIVGNPGWGNGELEYYTSNNANIYLTNGFLHIRAQSQMTNSSEGTFNYTSGRIKTQGLFSKKYGRIEWRASLPSGTGFWPALWTLGTNIANTPWPGCGEIDVVENNGTPNFEQGSIHSGSDATKVFNFNGGDSVTNLHVYDLDWTNNAIVWSVDGVGYETQTVWSSSTSNPYPFPFNQPFFFLMNLAVGGQYLNFPTTNSINPNMPGEVVLDYMRVYDYVGATNTLPTPTGLTAATVGSFVVLNWNDLFGTSVCNIKRATVSGGPYTTIGTSPVASYTDTGAVSCATYYYVVSRTNSIGESANSAEVTATLGPFYIGVNSGGGAAGTFVADTDFVGGTASSTAASINTSNVTNPAPQAVYQTERWGDSLYTFGGLRTGTTYTVRLHFAEIYFNAAGQRKFNVFINGLQVLTNLDVWATAGGEDIAMIREYSVLPKTNGQISITFSNGAADSAKSSGIEIVLPSTAAPTGLTASGMVGQVTLTWSAVSGATGYNVERSTVSGNSYVNIASGVTSTTYIDTNVTGGVTYYYVVSSLKGLCVGGSSSEVNATPSSVLSPFQQWQVQYFFSTTNSQAAANVDADGTGQNNLFKYVAGLDPTNPASVFVVTVNPVPNNSTAMNVLFDPMVTQRTYTPQFSTDLVSGAWFPLVGYVGPTTNGNQIMVTDPNATTPQKFYRIDITYP
jgi:beta-glucanase (GH16 family)